jgi:ribosomal protein S18 acetylase RimI-like enzyme
VAVFSIRQLTKSDLESYRAVRLRALKEEPTAFGGSYEETLARADQETLAFLDRNAIFGGFIENELFGFAGFFVHQGEKLQHKGELFHMYVAPEQRGTGLAQALVEAVIALAKQRVEVIKLTVVETNAPARKLYERNGFETYGVEGHALKVEGAYHDELLMQRYLKPIK